MVIKIQAFQKQGIDTKELIDEYKFCCWADLANWLSKFQLYECNKCKTKHIGYLENCPKCKRSNNKKW